MTRRVAILLAALALLIPYPAASDVPTRPSILAPSAFESVGSGGGPRLSGQDTEAAAAPSQPRTLSPAPSPAPATLAPSARAVPRLASRRSAGTPQRGQDSRPTGPMTGVQRGTASTYGPAFGPGWLAVPQGPGIHVRVCGAARCIERTSTDAGPDLATQRAGRIVDLSVRDFELVCGCSWTRGLTSVTVTVVE